MEEIKSCWCETVQRFLIERFLAQLDNDLFSASV